MKNKFNFALRFSFSHLRLVDSIWNIFLTERNFLLLATEFKRPLPMFDNQKIKKQKQNQALSFYVSVDEIWICNINCI